MWQAMFAAAWACPDGEFETLRTFLLDQVPFLLPCRECRNHWVSHLKGVHRRAGGEPRDRAHAFEWLWHMKHAVNASFHPPRPSLPFRELSARYTFHGGAIDDVALADALVLMALSARDLKRDDFYVEMCRALARLLPLPADSQFRLALETASRPVIGTALCAARAARIERGLGTFPLTHYRAAADA